MSDRENRVLKERGFQPAGRSGDRLFMREAHCLP